MSFGLCSVGSFAMYAPHASTQIVFYTAAGWALYANADSINATCPGTFTASVKHFEITHPNLAKAPDEGKQWRLRHWCVETRDCAGGIVMYRNQITTTKESTTNLEMPGWFKYLIEHVIVCCSPYEHFGNDWGRYIDQNIIEIHTSKGGAYNI